MRRIPTVLPPFLSHDHLLTDATFLQAYEDTLEALERLVTLNRQLIEAQRQGETIGPAILNGYVRQVENITMNRERLQSMLAMLWTTIGETDAH